MKLFLTSMYSNVSEHILELLNDSPQNMTVGFIPTAADPYEDKSFVAVDRDKLIEQGFKIQDVELHNQTTEELEKELSNIQVLFIAGGNTFYLLQQIRKTGLDKILGNLSDKGVVFVGSGAGSVIAGPNIEPVKAFDDPSEAPNLTDYTGLDLVPFVLLPHYGKPKYEDRYQQVIQEYSAKGLILKALKDDEYYLSRVSS